MDVETAIILSRVEKAAIHIASLIDYASGFVYIQIFNGSLRTQSIRVMHVLCEKKEPFLQCSFMKTNGERVIFELEPRYVGFYSNQSSWTKWFWKKDVVLIGDKFHSNGTHWKSMEVVRYQLPFWCSCLF